MSKVKKDILYVRIPIATKRRLTRKAKAEDLPVSKVVTRLLDKAMKEELVVYQLTELSRDLAEKQRSDEFADQNK